MFLPLLANLRIAGLVIPAKLSLSNLLRFFLRFPLPWLAYKPFLGKFVKGLTVEGVVLLDAVVWPILEDGLTVVTEDDMILSLFNRYCKITVSNVHFQTDVRCGLMLMLMKSMTEIDFESYLHHYNWSVTKWSQMISLIIIIFYFWKIGIYFEKVAHYLKKRHLVFMQMITTQIAR